MTTGISRLRSDDPLAAAMDLAHALTQKSPDQLAAAKEGGVNFFDNAEVYANGRSETIMGEAFRQLKWPRLDYVVSTKFFWGLNDKGREGPNKRNTLNRKYLMQAIDGSLKRLQLDFVDLVYAHRADASTPIEETVWAFHNIIESGRALYWGTSMWPAARIAQAVEFARANGLHALTFRRVPGTARKLSGTDEALRRYQVTVQDRVNAVMWKAVGIVPGPITAVAKVLLGRSRKIGDDDSAK